MGRFVVFYYFFMWRVRWKNGERKIALRGEWIKIQLPVVHRFDFVLRDDLILNYTIRKNLNTLSFKF